ncbi:helix-turn-helix domain-containing protein [Streptomyces sp. NBC_00988]|uniref:PucR family transcriptional regulator n=1 Tax=Streptomyces sp. NBC_00988 TaxID=2903704 RepID=UPI00386B0D61|nr:helix-turn-helix domain-containing protein [Streptomyces sp. NBC_00988]
MDSLSPAARSLAARCEPRVNELARRMTRTVFEDLHGYAELPVDVRDVEITATARQGLRQFLRTAAGGEVLRPTADGGLRYFQDRAHQRADEGMPLQLLLGTYTSGAHVLWQALTDAARPGEESALTELCGALIAAQGRVIAAVTESYLDEQAAIAAERGEQRRSLARALLEGTRKAEGWEGPVLVVHLRFAPRQSGGVAVRRLVRRVQTALDRLFGTEVPALLDGTGGHALVPGRTELPDAATAVLREAAGPGLRLAATVASGAEDIPDAARVGEEIVRVARACGHAPGPHHLDDVLLEYHLSRPSAGSARIAALLDPLADRPDLTATLRTHLEQRQDRRATARVLGLHPNSVDYRLARITELTGLDLGTPRDAALALAALLLGSRQAS